MKKVVLFLFVLAVLRPSLVLAAPAVSDRLIGRILLQVESKGEAWYVNPKDSKRYFLNRPADAFEVMKKLGIGISNADLKKIPIALISSPSADNDNDGLPNDLEVAIGSNPNKADTDGDGYNDKQELISGHNLIGGGKDSFDKTFSSKSKGKIFLQVQGAGEAWYVDPVSAKRYFLGRPADAFVLMRSLGLGITNFDLAKITPGSLVINTEVFIPESSPVSITNPAPKESPLDLSFIEQRIHVLINQQRASNSLPVLKWNNDIAAVAREHSDNQATDNLQLTQLEKICSYAMIHHEGLIFGLMPADRLANRNVNYFSKAGENIALIGAAEINYLINTLTFDQGAVTSCQTQAEEWNTKLRYDLEELTTESEKISRLNQETATRKAALALSKTFKISNINWRTNEQAAQESVTGWMNSPGHRANILDPAYDEAGVGVAYVNGYIIATQVFIKRAVCGYKGGPCCARAACYLPTSCRVDDVCR